MNVSFDGIGDSLVTFLNENCARGDVVKVSAAGSVSPCAENEAFDGLAVIVDGAYAGVRMGGFVTVRCSGTLPEAGRAQLAADGTGGVMAAEGGENYLVVDRDSAAKTLTIKL